MFTLPSFDWRRLTQESALEHRLDADGVLRLRARRAPDKAPFDALVVRDLRGGFAPALLPTIGLVWFPCPDGDGWMLRTTGPVVTMDRAERVWGDLARAMANPFGIDERLVLTSIACESGAPWPDEDGFVKAPRTEVGYPRRTGEGDPGDFERDGEDWRNYVLALRHGRPARTHSSHGLMQTLIATAYAVRTNLFAHVDPRFYRAVLWHPQNAISCGVGYLATFPAGELLDPLAARLRYGAGGIRPAKNRWGALLYDEIVPAKFVAFWNDAASLRASAREVA
jgi:hypothetical protein